MGATGGGTAVGLNISGGGALTAVVGAAKTSPAGVESAWVGGDTSAPPSCSPVNDKPVDAMGGGVCLLFATALSSPVHIGGVLVTSALLVHGASWGDVIGESGAANPDCTSPVEGIIAGAEVRRFRMPTTSEDSVGLGRAADLFISFFLLAFLSSLCFLRNSARSFFETPSSTNCPVVLPGGTFCAKNKRKNCQI